MERDRKFIVGTVTVLVGYLVGVLTVFVRGGDSSAVVRYLASETEADWGQAFVCGPAFVLAVRLCGLFFFGWLCLYPLIFYKAFGLGYAAGLLFCTFGTKGFLPLGLCLFPSAVAECILLIRASGDAFSQSFVLFRGLNGEGSPFFSSLRPYLLRSLVLFQCSSFVLLWDLFLSPLILSGIRDLL